MSKEISWVVGARGGSQDGGGGGAHGGCVKQAPPREVGVKWHFHFYENSAVESV